MLEMLTLSSLAQNLNSRMSPHPNILVAPQSFRWTITSIFTCFTHQCSAGPGGDSVGDGVVSMVELCVVLAEGQ